MIRYVLRRSLAGVVIVAATATITFGLFLAGPFDPAATICGKDCTPQRYTAIRQSLGVDVPFLQHLGQFFGKLVVGGTVRLDGVPLYCHAPCLGVSYERNAQVTDLIVHALPVTVAIALGGAGLAIVGGIALGTAAARRRGTVIDKLIVAAVTTVQAVPYYLFALLAYLLFALHWHVFVLGGYHPLFGSGGFWANLGPWAHSLLPAWLVVGAVGAASYTRWIRTFVLDALSQDYTMTARAKGVAERRIVRQALRAGLAPLVTIFALDLAGLLSGAIFTEQIFGLNGLGRLAFSSIATDDLPVLVGTAVFAAALIVAANILTDIWYTVLDPRVKLG